MMEKLGQAKTHLELKKMIAEVDTTNSGLLLKGLTEVGRGDLGEGRGAVISRSSARQLTRAGIRQIYRSVQPKPFPTRSQDLYTERLGTRLVGWKTLSY